MRRKITVVGSGALAGACALLVAERGLADVVLVGAGEDAAGDVAAAAAVCGAGVSVVASGDWEKAAGSAVVVVDAGAGGLEDAARQIARHLPDAVVVVAGRGEAEACHTLLATTGFPRRRVLGAVGLVTAARLRSLVAAELGLEPGDVGGVALGGPGGDAIVVAASVTAGGLPVAALLGAGRLADVGATLRQEAATGPLAHAAAVREVVEAVLLDRRRILPCTACCQGEYGLAGEFATVPVRVGAGGIAEVIVLDLEDDEAEAMFHSAR
jgi:malate dehydrogenase